MPTPTEHKIVQARILAYVQDIWRKFVFRVKGAIEITEDLIYSPKRRTDG